MLKIKSLCCYCFTIHWIICLVFLQIWDTEKPDGTISLVHSYSMRQFNWGYTQFSQFNADDTLLLVSGVYLGPHHSSSGEIAVFSLGRDCFYIHQLHTPTVNLSWSFDWYCCFGSVENYTLLSRVRNKPYDVFGCWLNETHLISGNLHWIGNMTSCSVLWLNKAFQVQMCSVLVWSQSDVLGPKLTVIDELRKCCLLAFYPVIKQWLK